MQSGKSFGRASVVGRTEPSATPKDDDVPLFRKEQGLLLRRCNRKGKDHFGQTIFAGSVGVGDPHGRAVTCRVTNFQAVSGAWRGEERVVEQNSHEDKTNPAVLP